MDETTPLFLSYSHKKKYQPLLILLISFLLTIVITLVISGIIILSGFLFCHISEKCKHNNLGTYIEIGFALDAIVIGIMIIIFSTFVLSLKIIYCVINKKIEL